jgi:hypothetical protein
MTQRTTVFVSYSHRDSRWLERLQVHLKPFSQRGDLALWDDTKLDAGDRWRSAIRDAIDRAAASVLLISADFLASDFVVSEELPRLLHKAEKAGSRIIPIIVQPCRLKNHPELASFQALNPHDKPLSKLSDAEAEDVFVKAAEQIEKLLRPASPRQHTHSDRNREGTGASTDIFGELQSAVILLSILVALAIPEAGLRPVEYTLTELTQALSVGSRKRAYDALDRLLNAGWIQKYRMSGQTRYRIASEGFRQLQRLADAADGPFRRATVRR